MLKVIEGAALAKYREAADRRADAALEAVREANCNGVSFEDGEDGQDILLELTQADTAAYLSMYGIAILDAADCDWFAALADDAPLPTQTLTVETVMRDRFKMSEDDCYLTKADHLETKAAMKRINARGVNAEATATEPA